MADPTIDTLAVQLKALEDRLAEGPKKKRERDCDHAGLVVSQDPGDGRKELLVCPDCDMEPRKRVSAAASIQEASEAAIAEHGAAIADSNKNIERLEEVSSALISRMDEITARLAKLESFGGAS